jgi:hypothetical protein
MPKKALLWIPLVPYVLSLFLPPFAIAGHNDIVPGIFILGIGWAGVLVFQFAWFANPLFLFALYSELKNRHANAVMASTAASALSLNAFTMFYKDQIPGGVGSGIVQEFVGAWFWLTAIWSLMFISIYMAMRRSDDRVSL